MVVDFSSALSTASAFLSTTGFLTMIHSHVRRLVRHFGHTLVFGLLLFGGVAQAQPGFDPARDFVAVADMLSNQIQAGAGSVPEFIRNFGYQRQRNN